MEKRKAKRIYSGFKAKITVGEKRLDGLIEDLSESGVSVMFNTAEKVPDLHVGDRLGIHFQPSEDESITLQCGLKWIDKMSGHGFSLKVGAEIFDPPWDKSHIFV